MKNKKNKKKELKIFYIIVNIVYFLFINNFVYADLISELGQGTRKTGVYTFTIMGIFGRIIKVLQVVSVIVAIVIVIVIGIKYMNDSVEEKAADKSKMKNYVIGAFIIFGAFNLIGLIYDIVMGLQKNVKV